MFHGGLLALSHTCPRRRRPTPKPRCTISHNKPLVAAHDVETFGTWNKQFYEVGGETAPRAAQPLSC